VEESIRLSRLAITKISTTEGDSALGTAFAVSRSLAITAFHCVGNRETQERLSRVRLNWTGGTQKTHAKFVSGDCSLDYALLELEGAVSDEFTPLRWSESVTAAGPFRAFGFPVSLPDVDMTCITGTVASSECTIFEGTPAIQLYCNESAAGLRLRGMSGAPVLVGNPEEPVGLIRWNPPSEEDSNRGIAGMVYATPLLVIRQRHPVFFPEDESKRSSEKQWKSYVHNVLLYAYYFDCEGRKNFFLADILMNHYYALREFGETGDIKGLIGVIVSNLPLIQETNDLDEDRLQLVVDYCVAKSYLRRKQGGRIFHDSFEITDAGRLYVVEQQIEKDASGRS
jgi:hypothetical protein